MKEFMEKIGWSLITLLIIAVVIWLITSFMVSWINIGEIAGYWISALIIGVIISAALSLFLPSGNVRSMTIGVTIIFVVLFAISSTLTAKNPSAMDTFDRSFKNLLLSASEYNHNDMYENDQVVHDFDKNCDRIIAGKRKAAEKVVAESYETTGDLAAFMTARQKIEDDFSKYKCKSSLVLPTTTPVADTSTKVSSENGTWKLSKTGTISVKNGSTKLGSYKNRVKVVFGGDAVLDPNRGSNGPEGINESAPAGFALQGYDQYAALIRIGSQSASAEFAGREKEIDLGSSETAIYACPNEDVSGRYGSGFSDNSGIWSYQVYVYEQN